MKNMMLLLLSLLLISCLESLPKGDFCTCNQILSYNDCVQSIKCEWNNTQGVCEDSKSVDLWSYCQVNSADCSVQIGCAFQERICKPFSGCTVYQAKTHELCQQISHLCSSNGEHCIQIELICDNFNENQIACQSNLDGFPCYWNNEIKKCYEIQKCNELPLSYSTHESCYEAGQKKQLQCTTKEGGGCIDIGTDCKIQEKKGCVVNIFNSPCFWDGSTCKDKICINAPTSYITHEQCQTYLGSCSLNSDNKGCMDMPSSCEEYSTEPQCIQINEHLCFWSILTCNDDDQQCQPISRCKQWTCENAEPSYSTDTLCQQFKSDCTVNNTNNGCIKRLETCSSYTTQNQCVIVLDGKTTCYWNGTKCVDNLCHNAVLNKYDLLSCSEFLSSCTAVNNQCTLKTCSTYPTENLCSVDYQNKKCIWSGSCTLKTCENASKELTTHQECQQWLSSCTVNSNLNGCQILEKVCNVYKKKDQCYLTGNNKTECLWIDEQCVQKSCSTASLEIQSDEECTNYLDGCMISNQKKGCVNRKATCTELLEHQCSITSSGSFCFWNGQQCVIRQCTQVFYYSFKACNTFLQTCTVNFDGTQYNGCITKQNKCNGYTNELMCIESLSEGKCVWNQKVIPNICEVRSCENSNQMTSDEECNQFLGICTVNNSKTGCIKRYEKCNEYDNEVNCRKTKSESECIWYNDVCINKTCDKANKTYTSHDECQSYSKKCTTNGKGCIQIDTCSSYTTKQGCVFDQNNQSCTYFPSCNLRLCTDAPQNYSTDEQCKNYMQECTTSGNGCVLRTECSDAYIEQACVTDSTGQQCRWINNKCVVYSCSSAPTQFQTEMECQLYKQGCTAKQSGGCITKGLCKDAKISQACTTDIYGNLCRFYKDGCREAICQDFAYKTHYQCVKIDSNCTSDGVTCVTQSQCNTKSQSGCFLGSDGPCLWIGNSCYQYSSCTSLQFQTHEECYKFNNECTTDGNTCVPIDKCEKLTQLGCQVGTDGQCVFLPNTNECKVFKNCNQFEYQTHQDCQSINKQCTTDNKKCIDLQECSSYTTKENCYLNNLQQQCKFDENDNKCIDLVCSHLKFATHNECNQQLNTCTTDSKQCITIDKCETYSKVFCDIAYGIESIIDDQSKQSYKNINKCRFDTKQNKCQLIKCSDLQKNCSQISKCVDNGIRCVDQSKCEIYETEKGCKQGGSDGECVWHLENGVGKCKLMTSCSDASTNKEACLQKPWICQWTENSTKTICAQYTCSSKYKETGFCLPILDFSQKNYQICSMTGQLCVNTKIDSLTASTCFQSTNYTYTWDSARKLCWQCGKQFTNSNKLNSSDHLNQTQEDIFASILLPMFILIFSLYI
ncbi:unnamed protein product [Paramecium sonneborni]|uniref:Uncharacterized protein n=1 Tax=Paramecium sonneborni TaxID=65129 RepID=A0A8S1N3K1_9CILI|nr:unnamed protein product [Paramecium sonneborni]